MAYPDLHPSLESVLADSSASRKASAADSILPPYAASADPCPPATMTKPLYDQPPASNDGQSYPVYPELYDSSHAGLSAAGAAASGDGGGQTTVRFPAMSQTQCGFPHDWDYGLGGFELSSAPSPPGIFQGEEGHGLQPQVPWDSGAQAYPAAIGGAMAMASPLSQYVPAEESMGGGCHELVKWPQPPMGQISPSPSQVSYYASSPASGCGSQFSKHNNSCSSPPALRAAVVEQTQFDALFQTVPDQVVSPYDVQLSPVRTMANGGFQAVAEAQPPQTSARNQKITTTTTMTKNHTTGTLSPAITPSPKDSTAAAAPYRPISQSARHTPDQQTPRSSRMKALQIAPRPTEQQKQAPQAHAQTQPTQKTRNRESANKCRAKMKLAVADLEATERAMSSENMELSATARGLRDQLLQLKNELLAHGNCDDTLIQQYLTNQARMVGGGGSCAVPAHRQHQHQHQHQHHHGNQGQSQAHQYHQRHQQQRQGGGRA